MSPADRFRNSCCSFEGEWRIILQQRIPLTLALCYAVRYKTTAESRYVQNLIVFEMEPEAKLLCSQTARHSGPYVEPPPDSI